MSDKAPSIDPEERVFTLADVRQFLSRKKRWIGKAACLGAALGLSFALLSRPEYQISATFKEAAEKSGEGLLKDLFGGLGGGADQPNAAVILRSNQVVQPLVERLGLQASVPPQRNKVQKLFRRVRENLQAGKGLPLEDIDTFSFANVHFPGETGRRYSLCFSDPLHFSLFTADRKREIARGKVGETVEFDGGRLTLTKVPTDLKLKKFYPLEIETSLGKAQELKGKLEIESHKLNKSISTLTLSFRDRHLGTTLLNEWMAEYQKYLKKEHDLVAEAQLSYLEKKQGRLFEKVEEVLKDYTHYLTQNIENKGVIGGEGQGSKAVLTPYQEIQQRLLKIEIELSWFEQDSLCKEGQMLFSNPTFGKRIHDLAQKIRDTNQQKDLLELSFSDRGDSLLELSQLEAKKSEIVALKKEQEGIKELLKEFEERQEILSSFPLPEGLALWAKSLSSESPEEQLLFVSSIKNYAHLLSLQEKALQERFAYQNCPLIELQGMDLETAKRLLVEYNARSDEKEALIQKYNQLEQEVKNPHFELSSLGSFLRDPFSLQLIEASNRVALQLKDEKYRSVKEEARWQKEIDWQKGVFSNHLSQLIKLEIIEKELFKEKIEKIQRFIFDLIHRQLSVYQEQIETAIEEAHQALLKEREILEKKGEDLLKMALDLPESWRLEKWFHLKSEMAIKMMEAITQLVESKTISHHLHHVESKPLDFATLPNAPKNPRLSLFLILGAALFSFGATLFALIRPLLHGFPTSPEKLLALNYPLLGEISPLCDGEKGDLLTGPDLDVLRKATLYLKKSSQQPSRLIALFLGKGPDYSFAFGKNLARSSHQPLLLDCDFLSPFRKEELPGLLQLVEGGATLTPRPQGGFDWVPAGGYTPFGAELIQSEPFHQFLQEMKGRYRDIFLVLRSPLSSAESLAVLTLVDEALVTVCGEETEVLTPFVKWAYDGDRCRLQFITAKPCR